MRNIVCNIVGCVALCILTLPLACVEADDSSSSGDGGAAGKATGGTGGKAKGGASATGGAGGKATGGASATGGAGAVGGTATGASGGSGQGGAATTGGASASGGAGAGGSSGAAHGGGGAATSGGASGSNQGGAGAGGVPANIFNDGFSAFNKDIWSCEYTCPTVVDGSALRFLLRAGIAPNNEGSWSKVRYKPRRFTAGKFSVRFRLTARPDRAVWWGIALWDDGPSADGSKFNEINFGYTTNQSFTNSQLFFESAKLGKAVSVKIDTGVNLYDGTYHTARLEYDATHVAFYFDGKLMKTIEDLSVIPTDPMDFIIGPRLVTGSAPLNADFAETVDWTEISW
jgi:hypothetical protein